MKKNKNLSFKFGMYRGDIFNVNGSLRQEIDNLLRIKHPNIIKGYQIFIASKLSDINVYNIDTSIIMELADQSLTNAFKSLMSNETKIRYMFEFLSGMRFLHSLGYIHCDVKCDNILVSQGSIKVSDLGLLLNRYTLPLFLDYTVFCNPYSTRAPELMIKDPKIYVHTRNHQKKFEINTWIKEYNDFISPILAVKNPLSTGALPQTFIIGEFYSIGRVLLEICLGRSTSEHVFESYYLTFKLPLLSFDERVKVIRSMKTWPNDLHGPEFLIASLLEGDPDKRLASYDSMLFYDFFQNNAYTEWIQGVIYSPSFISHNYCNIEDIKMIIARYIVLSTDHSLPLFHFYKSLALFSTIISLFEQPSLNDLYIAAAASYVLALDRHANPPRFIIINEIINKFKIKDINELARFILQAYNYIGGITTIDSIFKYTSSANTTCNCLSYYLDCKIMQKYTPQEYVQIIENEYNKFTADQEEHPDNTVTKHVRLPKNVSVKAVKDWLFKQLHNNSP